MLNPRARQFLPFKIARLLAIASPSRCPPLMNWIAATLASAVFLGCYDLCTKHAVRDNAVLPVLFLANLCSAVIWLSLLELQRLQPGLLPPALLAPHLTFLQHAQLALKSLIVAASWLCTYFAVKH